MIKVKMHSGCITQDNIVLKRSDPPAAICSCTHKIDLLHAFQMVKEGAAKWCITERIRGYVDVDCDFCFSMTDVEKKSCAKCIGTGKIKEYKVWEVSSSDIVLLGISSANFTIPRTFTVEKRHIVQAYVYELEYAKTRIEEFHKTAMEFRAKWLAPYRPDPYEGRSMFVSFPSTNGISVNDNGCSKDAYMFDWREPLLGFPRGVFKQGVSNNVQSRLKQVQDECRVLTSGTLSLVNAIEKGGFDFETSFKKDFSRYRLPQHVAAQLGLPFPTEWYDGIARPIAFEYFEKERSKN